MYKQLQKIKKFFMIKNQNKNLKNYFNISMLKYNKKFILRN